MENLFLQVGGVILDAKETYLENSKDLRPGEILSVGFDGLYTPDEDPNGAKIQALARLALTAVDHANKAVRNANSSGDAFEVMGSFGYLENIHGQKEGKLTFYAPAGHEEAYEAWFKEVVKALRTQKGNLRKGWRKEEQGGREWFVHPLTKADADIFEPLITFAHGEGIDEVTIKDPRFKCRQPREFKRIKEDPGEFRVRADAMGEFLKLAGLEQDELHAAPAVQKIRQ